MDIFTAGGTSEIAFPPLSRYFIEFSLTIPILSAFYVSQSNQMS
jgi:hypothetical protein